ncbi:hypothetical protein TNIN_15521 [Trichonephila inaurata madagascariensis]|uniref:Secreted protein n=1 Tax=Trichonephila inaurata madagascariensis TaxID=2747483 RepID=A0A8X6YJQ7_9ARAC|nr:hypothetical protein TNIN_15521 [Trichonephila inaurata madagascariensis]
MKFAIKACFLVLVAAVYLAAAEPEPEPGILPKSSYSKEFYLVVKEFLIVELKTKRIHRGLSPVESSSAPCDNFLRVWKLFNT